MATVVMRTNGRDPMGWLIHGAISGLIAGVVFMLFEMAVAAWSIGPNAVLIPLRMVGAIVLGRVALDPGYSVVTAGVSGVVVHLTLSALFGSLFGAILPAAAELDVPMPGGRIVLAATVYGLLLWLINFYGLAPTAGLSWFPNRASPLVQFAGHTFCYGTVLGLCFQNMVSDRVRVPGHVRTRIGRSDARATGSTGARER
jgi:hypothetical protein